MLSNAVDHDLVVVTENAADFVPLLDSANSAGEAVPIVILALKRQDRRPVYGR